MDINYHAFESLEMGHCRVAGKETRYLNLKTLKGVAGNTLTPDPSETRQLPIFAQLDSSTTVKQ